MQKNINHYRSRSSWLESGKSCRPASLPAGLCTYKPPRSRHRRRCWRNPPVEGKHSGSNLYMYISLTVGPEDHDDVNNGVWSSARELDCVSDDENVVWCSRGKYYFVGGGKWNSSDMEKDGGGVVSWISRRLAYWDDRCCFRVTFQSGILSKLSRDDMYIKGEWKWVIYVKLIFGTCTSAAFRIAHGSFYIPAS